MPSVKNALGKKAFGKNNIRRKKHSVKNAVGEKCRR
jgi:hypothetical protein